MYFFLSYSLYCDRTKSIILKTVLLIIGRTEHESVSDVSSLKDAHREYPVENFPAFGLDDPSPSNKGDMCSNCEEQPAQVQCMNCDMKFCKEHSKV